MVYMTNQLFHTTTTYDYRLKHLYCQHFQRRLKRQPRSTMSHFTLNHTRTRERTPDYDTYYTRPLIRRNSGKHQRDITLSDDDDGHDDYPYSSNHKPSRALTLRNQPSQLERYNILSDRWDKRSDKDEERRRSYKYTSDRHYHTDNEEAEEREFRLKINATFGRPKSYSPHYHHSSHAHNYTHLSPQPDILHRRENRVDEAWECRERSKSRERISRRRTGFWGDVEAEKEKESEEESWSRYRRVNRTKTEEFRPLSGWRRNRIVFEN
ncbi:hypothetical protein EJ02DRAFT_18046 [Clathrospora elynae]|uniref:Uncharacterized protein n=1 Tax=Clathrospora elynae TaxID=706981 RepID=A0A6A5SGV3_9PLEO|nr:hypothetical protein EJ02DRAFT_18046 [Clathrospora elynae]